MSNKEGLIDTIGKQSSFTTFAKLMRSSTAGELLAGEGSFTIFAPTNAAFDKMTDVEMSGLLGEKNKTALDRLMSYHIVSGKLFAAAVAGKGVAESLSGDEVRFSDTNGIKVNNSKMQARNIEAANGVLHGIDTVLTPPAFHDTTVVPIKGASASPPPAVTAAETKQVSPPRTGIL